MPEEKVVARHRKHLDRNIVSAGMGIALFFKAAVENQVADVFNHPPVLEVQHADFCQKETHVQEYNPCKEAERPCDGLVSENLHPGKNTLNFSNWFQIPVIGALI